MLNTSQQPSDGRKGLGRLIFEHVPAWITAITSVITLVIGFGAGYGTSKVQTAAVPAPTVTVTVGSSPPGGTPSSNSGASATPAVRHKGMLELNDFIGADLDSTANNWGVATNYTSGDIYLAQGSISSNGQLANLDSSSPDYHGCSSTTDYVQNISVSSLNPGADFCIHTDKKRWSLVHVTKVSQDSISMDVTTWQLTGS